MKAHTPGFDALMANSNYTLDTKDELTYSGPGGSSMLTGVNSGKQVVDDNKFTNYKAEEFPHFFKYLPASIKLVSIAH
ncbi:MAG: hypothetical protein ACI9O4_001629 [Chitinophagales bacterium]|jgi:hypothetical protein